MAIRQAIDAGVTVDRITIKTAAGDYKWSPITRRWERVQ